MASKINPKQMEGWVDKLETNIGKFIDAGPTDQEEKLSFIRDQYALLNITIQVLNGTAYFIGCPHPKN
jgi:hypothetical protein